MSSAPIELSCEAMALKIDYPDKILAGVWQSYTVNSDEGVPDGDVLLGGKPLKRKIIPLRPPKWKVTFFLEAGAAGKNLTLKFQNAGSCLEETKAIEAG